jgi:PAS domain S-box-containing protein
MDGMSENETILVVDDDPALRLIASRLFKQAGYVVAEAGTAAECLRLAREEKPDLILLDVILPDGNGVDVCRRIKTEAAPDAFVILLSAVHIASESQALGLDAGADGYIAWPISNQEMLARVQAMLRLRRTEWALQASEEKYRGLVAHSSDAIILADEQGQVVEWNQAAETITGLKRSDVLGRFLWDVLFQMAVEEQRTQAAHEQVRAMMLDFLVTGDAPWLRRPQEVEIQCLDGTRRVTQSVVFPIQTEHGFMAGSIMRDVTDRVQVQEALHELNVTLEAQVARRTAQLRAERDRIEAILQQVDDAIGMIAPDLRIRYVNPAFTALTGYSEAEILGQPMYALLGEKAKEAERQAMWQAVTKGQGWHGEITAWRKDGRAYEAELTIAPMLDAQGSLSGYVSSQRDISRFKELDRARSQFMANISHELRTPVTNLKLYAHMLRRGIRPESIRPDDIQPERIQPDDIQPESIQPDDIRAEKTEHFAQVMEEQADRLATLVQDILEMAELDSGRTIMNRRRVTMSLVVSDAVESYQGRAGAAGVRLVSGPVPRTLPMVMGDPARLTQGLGEVLDNAIVFTPAGGQVVIEVGTAESEGQEWVTIVVRDSGPGIPPDEQEHIFARLYRGSAAQSGHVPGTGLGLSIAAEILRAHGGNITVQSPSEQGGGSAFTLWLPSES